MYELYFKMSRHNIKLEINTIVDDHGLDCMIFDFISVFDGDVRASTVMYLDRVRTSPDFVIKELNRTLDYLISTNKQLKGE